MRENCLNVGAFDELEKTPYETGPVENINGALRAFVESYDHLQLVLQKEFAYMGEVLRATMYAPVTFWGERPPISLYEIGITHSPHGTTAGKYSMNEEKLKEALRFRAWEARMLFVQDETGILDRLCNILMDFRGHELPDDVYSATVRFLNESRRLRAMWS